MNMHIIKATPQVAKPVGEAPKDQKVLTRGHSNYIITNVSDKYCESGSETITVHPMLEPTVRAMQGLSRQSQELIAMVVRQLAEREGVNVGVNTLQGLNTPAEGIPLWTAKLKLEGYSRQTIELYLLTVQSYLKRDPVPTRLSIQQWLAERMEQVSTARVSNDRKALRSLFSFLHSEGLWLNDPTIGLKHIRVRYRARELPDTADIAKLLQYRCYRSKDSPKFLTMLLLLVTTGLRLSEAASILKRNIDFEANEIKVIGKGNKERVVPVSPMTASLLKAWIEQDGHSEWLFPANNSTGYLSEVSFEKTIKRVCKRNCIKPMTPHALRHYFATHNLKNGARLEVVSKILGHASTSITADIYVHIDREDIHNAHKQFSPFSKLMLSQSL